MSFQYQILKYTPNVRGLGIRELQGKDELTVTGTGTMSALDLINGLLAGNGKAEDIATADRDCMLAVIYRATYGPKVESIVTCRFCDTKIDLNFSIDDLQKHVQENQTEPVAEALEDGTYRLPSGCRFRLPTGEDELAVANFPAEKAAAMLLERCLIEGDPARDGEQVQEAMAKVAPVLQMEMTALCPECGKEQQLRFDIQSFLLSRLKNERKQTSWEVHRLAFAYKWSHQEILDLPRSLRRLYVGFLET